MTINDLKECMEFPYETSIRCGNDNDFHQYQYDFVNAKNVNDIKIVLEKYPYTLERVKMSEQNNLDIIKYLVSIGKEIVYEDIFNFIFINDKDIVEFLEISGYISKKYLNNDQFDQISYMLKISKVVLK
jgi:hypothetical protein